jgi:hypothetical protein
MAPVSRWVNAGLVDSFGFNDLVNVDDTENSGNIKERLW